MAGKDPCGTQSTGTSKVLSHIAFNPIGQPEPYKHGDDFYQFCNRFTEFVCLHGIEAKLDLLFLSLVDDKTHASLKFALLENEDKLCPVKLCDAYKRVKNPGLINGAIIAQLFTMKQEIHESIDEFSYRIVKIAQKMTADEMTISSHKLEAFILGISNVHIKVEILRCENISFEQAVHKARQIESILKGNNEPDLTTDHQSCHHLDHDTGHWTTVSKMRARKRPEKYYSHRSKSRPYTIKNNNTSFFRERSYDANPKPHNVRSNKSARRCRDDDQWCPFQLKGKSYFRHPSRSVSEHLNMLAAVIDHIVIIIEIIVTLNGRPMIRLRITAIIKLIK